MKPIKILALFLAFALAGCAGTSGLRKKFSDKQSSLGYLGEGRATAAKPVALASYRLEAGLPPRTEVTRVKSLVIPALVYTYWGHDFALQLGESALDTSIVRFGEQSLASDLRRAGFRLADTSAAPKVSVRINKLRSGAVYYKKNYVIFLVAVYSIHMGEGARDLESSLDADIFIERAGTVDSVRFVHTESASVPAPYRNRNIPQTVVDAMAETLSLCFKSLNTRIVDELSKAP